MKLALDTNLLLVLVIGLTDRSQVGLHKRTRAFRPEAFDLLLKVAIGATQIVVTPHILAETSNLLGQDEDLRTAAYRAKLAEMMNLHEELHISAVDVAADKAFIRLGVADCGALALLSEDLTLMTSDLGLYLEASLRDPKTVNFTYLQRASGIL